MAAMGGIVMSVTIILAYVTIMLSSGCLSLVGDVLLTNTDYKEV